MSELAELCCSTGCGWVGVLKRQERCPVLFLETQMKNYESVGGIAGQQSSHNLVAVSVTRITRDDTYQGLQEMYWLASSGKDRLFVLCSGPTYLAGTPTCGLWFQSA